MDEDTQRQIDAGMAQVAALYEAGRFSEAVPLAENLRDVCKKVLGPEHPDFATSLNNLASLYHRALGDYARAESLYQLALEIRERVLGADHPVTAMSLNNLGMLYRELGDYVRAERLYHRALELCENGLGPEHPVTAQVRNNLAVVCHMLGDYPRAVLLFERALQIYEGAPSPGAQQIAVTLNNLASSYGGQGDYARAVPLCARALSIREDALGAEHPDIAKSLNNLACLYRVLGDYERAAPLFRRALLIREHVFGTEHPDTATSVLNLADLYRELGDYAKAQPLYQRALAIYESKLGPEHPSTAISVNGLALLYQQVGDYTGAEPLYQRGLIIHELTLGSDHPNTATSLSHLGALYYDEGDYARAAPFVERAVMIYERALGPEHPNTAAGLNNLAELHDALGNYARAVPLCERALAIQERTLGTQHPHTATSLNNLALLCQRIGNYARAESLFQRALAIRESVLGINHPVTASSLSNLATNHAMRGKPQEALAAVIAAAQIEDRLIGQIFSFLTEGQRRGYLAAVRGTSEIILSLVLTHFADSREAIRSALDHVLQRKALTAEAAGAQQRAILEGRYPELRDRLELLHLLRGQIARKVMTGPAPGELGDHDRTTLANWQREREELESELARSIPETRLEQRLAAVDAHAVSRCLKGEEVLVEFARFKLLDFQAGYAQGQKRWAGERYVAFVLLAGESESTRLVDLGNAAAIDSAIQQLRQQLTGELSDPKGIGSSEERVSSAPTLQETAEQSLHALIVGPMLPVLGNRRVLIVSPDGELNRLPFEALPMPDGRYLIDHYSIRYVTSGRDMARIAGAETLPGSDPLVVADPAFDLGSRQAYAAAPKGCAPLVPAAEHAAEGAWLGRHSRDLARGEIRFDPLPGSREEGQNLGQRLGALPLIGESALEGRLKKQRSPAIVHLATHGFFLENQPWKPPAFGFSAEMGVMDRLRGHENPMLRSGLALAGANTFLRERRSVSDEMEDGLLTAEDVAGIDLLNTELVFLSACETGLGDIQVGEGVFGLRRAFVIAGARTLIMTLWKVSDLATAILVDHFYDRLLAGTPKGKALRQAQHDLRTVHLGKLRPRWLSEPMRERLAAGDANQRRKLDELAAMPDDFRPFTHPYYWAAFILQGDDGALRWRPRVPTTKGTAALSNHQ